MQAWKDSFCEHGCAAEQRGQGLTWRSVLLVLISLYHRGERGKPQAEGVLAWGIFIQFSFPAELDASSA